MIRPNPLAGVRLVALDLDGTLLPASKQVTPLARRVVGDLRDAGIHVTLATGRGWVHAERYARELGLLHPLVTYEGALVATPSAAPDDPRGRHVLHHALLHADLVRRVAESVSDLELGAFVCTADGRTLASESLRGRVEQIAVWSPRVDFVDVWLDADAHGYILHLVGPPADVAEARRRMRALCGDGAAGWGQDAGPAPGPVAEAVATSPAVAGALADARLGTADRRVAAHVATRASGWHEIETFHAEFWDGFDQIQIRPHGIGKDAGLRHVLTHLGLGAEHLLAAGDWLNDLGMLRMARVAVAPSNAVPQVRAVATHVLEESCEEDAVVRFLDECLRGM